MHTVRNRIASKPRQNGKVPSHGAPKMHEPAFMLRSGNPPAFPAGLIIPAPRGALITAVPWPEAGASETGISARPASRQKVDPGKPHHGKSRKRKPTPKRKPKPYAGRSHKALAAANPAFPLPNSLNAEAPVTMMTEDLLDRALAMKPVPAEDALILPLAPPMAPAAPSPATAGANPCPQPIPRSNALTAARSTALLDIIGYWLRDAGNWLVRRNTRRRKAEERALIARATARHHALQSQHDALAALREANNARAMR